MGFAWGGLCIRHAMMHRRCKPNDDGSPSIYDVKHPGVRQPKLFPLGGGITSKPTKDQQDNAKIKSPGIKGFLVGYVTQPGGAWNGDYMCVDLRDFELGSARKRARVYGTQHSAF